MRKEILKSGTFSDATKVAKYHFKVLLLTVRLYRSEQTCLTPLLRNIKLGNSARIISGLSESRSHVSL